MLNRLTQSTSKDTQSLKSSKSTQISYNQHGLSNNTVRILLDVPPETLTGVTSYLDPPSLLCLGRVNGHLYEHVKNDTTWHRAFVCQFLGIGPESDVHHNMKSLMLRRSESSWKRELIVRYNLRRRWERSRNTTIAHVPVPSSVSSMHLMPGHFLLSSSVEYGIISRSLPLTGKVFSGFLDASGTHIGMGVGNPNAEFTPNISVCAVISDGGTARVLWGYRNGEVAIMTAPKTMDGARRISTSLIRSDVNDEHDGAVLAGLWDEGSGMMVITAGADGKVKVWDAKQVRCVWTSERKESLVPDACVKVAASLSQGFVVGALRSGEIVLWTGFNFQALDTISTSSISEFRIPYPASALRVIKDSDQDVPHNTMFLYLDSNASYPTILVNYQNDPYFYRIRVVQENKIEVTAFGDKQFGPISVLTPFFSADSSFVLTGDHIGCVSVYDWRVSTPPSTTPSSAIQPVKKFEAHEDGAGVTALAWNGMTLVTGSARGATHVWDGLTFDYLRSFPSPMPRRSHGVNGNAREREAVSQILVGPEKDVLLVAVGDRVLAWRAGPASKNSPGGVRGRHTIGSRANRRTKEGRTAGKYLQQLELKETISESRTLLELQSTGIKRTHGREREQLATLESMGLDEAEAVEYVLMLSRDEALRDGRGHQTTNAEEHQFDIPVEEGVFEGDFDDIPSARRRPIAQQLMTTSSSTSSLISSARSGMSTPQSSGRPIPRVRLSASNQKIQISPPYKPEAMEAGTCTGSTSTSVVASSEAPTDESHFPPMSASVSPSRSPSTAAVGDRHKGSPIQNKSPKSVSGSAQSTKSTASTSAWKKPLIKSAAGSPGSASPSGRGSRTSPPAIRSGSSSSLPLADIDDDLKYAIELSLAEARSRGEMM